MPIPQRPVKLMAFCLSTVGPYDVCEFVRIRRSPDFDQAHVGKANRLAVIVIVVFNSFEMTETMPLLGCEHSGAHRIQRHVVAHTLEIASAERWPSTWMAVVGLIDVRRRRRFSSEGND